MFVHVCEHVCMYKGVRVLICEGVCLCLCDCACVWACVYWGCVHVCEVMSVHVCEVMIVRNGSYSESVVISNRLCGM